MKLVKCVLAAAILLETAALCSAAEKKDVERFNVVAFDDRAILVDTMSGDTWLLMESAKGGNKSGFVWQQIPSPFGPPVAAKEGKTPNASVPVPASPAPPTVTQAQPTLATGPLGLDVESPSVMGGGGSGTFLLRITSDEVLTLPEVRIQLPSPLKPIEASEGFERADDSLLWRNVKVSPDKPVVRAVRATVGEADKRVVRFTATAKGKVLEAERALSVRLKASSGEAERPAENDVAERME